MDIQLPSPQTTLAILLGASEWPESPEFHGSRAFANAMSSFRRYLFDPYGFGLPEENALDLFDDTSGPHLIDSKIRQFLDSKIAAVKLTGHVVKDLLLYFVGHGGFAGRNSDYYLAVRCTSTENARLSGIPVESLAFTLTDKARYLRRILILDCCYAAAAFTSFQAEGQAKLGIDQTFRAFDKQAKTVGKGTTLLCSSGKTVASQIAQDQSCTMFSKALLQVLFTGDEHRQEQHYFSLREVADLTEEVITRELEGKAPRPEIHSPDQKEGDVANIPFFPNLAAKKASAIRSTPIPMPSDVITCSVGHENFAGTAFCDICGELLLWKPSPGWGTSTPDAQQSEASWNSQSGIGGQPSWNQPAAPTSNSPWGQQQAPAQDPNGTPSQRPQQYGGYGELATWGQPSSSTPSADSVAPAWQQTGLEFGDADTTLLRNPPGPLLDFVQVKEGLEPGRIYEVRGLELSIGSSRESDIFLEDPAVSPFHATIFFQGSGFALIDEGSINGTRVNNQLLAMNQKYSLQPGDEIRLGQTILVFHTKRYERHKWPKN